MTGVISIVTDKIEKVRRSPCADGKTFVVSIETGEDSSIIMLEDQAKRLYGLLGSMFYGRIRIGAIPVDITYRDLKLTVYVERGMTQLPYGGARPDGSVTVVSVIDDRGIEVMGLIEALDPNAIITFEEEAAEAIEGMRQMHEEDRRNEEHGK
jgi:hypothetical protein